MNNNNFYLAILIEHIINNSCQKRQEVNKYGSRFLSVLELITVRLDIIRFDDIPN